MANTVLGQPVQQDENSYYMAQLMELLKSMGQGVGGGLADLGKGASQGINMAGKMLDPETYIKQAQQGMQQLPKNITTAFGLPTQEQAMDFASPTPWDNSLEAQNARSLNSMRMRSNREFQNNPPAPIGVENLPPPPVPGSQMARVPTRQPSEYPPGSQAPVEAEPSQAAPFLDANKILSDARDAQSAEIARLGGGPANWKQPVKSILDILGNFTERFDQSYNRAPSQRLAVMGQVGSPDWPYQRAASEMDLQAAPYKLATDILSEQNRATEAQGRSDYWTARAGTEAERNTIARHKIDTDANTKLAGIEAQIAIEKANNNTRMVTALEADKAKVMSALALSGGVMPTGDQSQQVILKMLELINNMQQGQTGFGNKTSGVPGQAMSPADRAKEILRSRGIQVQ